ncbi:hypothetical protein JCM19000A_18810 [Silvimonas sp. JCM 19000]
MGMAALIAALGSTPAQAADDDTVLLIQLRGSLLDERDHPQNEAIGYGDFELQNIQTKDWYSSRTQTSNGSLFMFHVKPGIYCLRSVRLALNVNVSYCGEPYFRVTSGIINDAGRWTFGFSWLSGHFSILDSMQNLEEVMDRAQTVWPKELPRHPDEETAT